MKDNNSFPKHEYYQKRKWIAFAGCGITWIISMVAFRMPRISEDWVSIIVQICILVGFISMLFYLFYFVKGMKVPASEEYKRTSKPWDRSDD